MHDDGTYELDMDGASPLGCKANASHDTRTSSFWHTPPECFIGGGGIGIGFDCADGSGGGSERWSHMLEYLPDMCSTSMDEFVVWMMLKGFNNA